MKAADMQINNIRHKSRYYHKIYRKKNMNPAVMYQDIEKSR